MADATPTAPTIIFKKRAGRANLKKRAATPPSESESDYSSAEDGETGSRIKRRRKAGITTSTSAITKPSRDLGKSTQFAGDRSAAITNLDDATKTSNWFHADDAARVSTEGDVDVEKDGTYKGAKGYGNFIQKNPDKLGKSVGPVKAPTNMRMITLVDFAPDVCKDYKQTGFVSFSSFSSRSSGWNIIANMFILHSAVSVIAVNSSTQEKTTNKAGNSTKNGKKQQNQNLQEEELQNPQSWDLQIALLPPPITPRTLTTTKKQKNLRKFHSRASFARNRIRVLWLRNAVITFARLVR
jgi:hypothetical protein